MARLPRLAVGGLPHVVTQLGHDRDAVFRDADDRATFLDVLERGARSCDVSVHAYVLLDTQVQLLATPLEHESLSRLMQGIGRLYVAWYNRRHGRAGTLWAGRFRATIVEPSTWLLRCMRHIERLPCEAGLVDEPARYEWSSARHHLGLRTDSVVREHSLFWQLGNTPFDRQAAYRHLLEERESERERAELASALLKGWALGPADFVRQLSTGVARRATPGRPGRPRIR